MANSFDQSSEEEARASRDKVVAKNSCGTCSFLELLSYTQRGPLSINSSSISSIGIPCKEELPDFFHLGSKDPFKKRGSIFWRNLAIVRGLKQARKEGVCKDILTHLF